MSTRTEKFNKEMQRELGAVFQARSRDWFDGAMITVTEVNSSPDLGYVKAYLSIFNAKNKNVVMEAVHLCNKMIRKELAGRIRKSVRVIPELSFFEDNSLENALKFEKIFDQLREERESRNTENEE